MMAERSAPQIASDALRRDARAKSVLDLPGVAALGAASLCKVGTQTFGEMFTSPDHADAVEAAATKRATKDPFSRYVKAVNHAVALESLLPENSVRTFQDCRELRKSVKLNAPDPPVLVVPVTVDRASQTDDKHYPETQPEVPLPPVTWFDAGIKIYDAITEPPEFVKFYLTPVNLARLRMLVLLVFVTRPIQSVRFLIKHFGQAVDHVMEEPGNHAEPINYTNNGLLLPAESNFLWHCVTIIGALVLGAKLGTPQALPHATCVIL